MNTYYVIAIILALILAGTHFLKKRKNVKVSWILALYRTKHGIRIINKIASLSPRFWKGFSTFGVAICFLSMGIIFYTLLKNTIKIFIAPGTTAGAVPVIPGITIPFWIGIIALITVLVSHEFSHGIIGRAEKIKLKSVGLASLGFLPIGAFVEPDDKQIKKAKMLTQLRVYAAGSFMNFIVAILAFLVVTFALVPLFANFVPAAHIIEVDAGSPAEAAGMEGTMILNSIAGTSIDTIDDFSKVTEPLKPQQTIIVGTGKGDFPVLLGEKDGHGYIGIQAVICTKNLMHPLCYHTHSWVPKSVFWFVIGAFNWIIILNLGIGMFNLLPLKPFDGGLMIESISKKMSSMSRKFIIRGLGIVSLFMIIINLAGPYIL